jgi:hypothetical protein
MLALGLSRKTRGVISLGCFRYRFGLRQMRLIDASRPKRLKPDAERHCYVASSERAEIFRRTITNRQPLTAHALKPDLRPINLGAAIDKKLLQHRGIEGPVLFRIQSQEDLSAWSQEALLQIVEKK